MSKRKVMIVDDDPQIRKILERLLGASQYEVLSVEDGREVLTRIQEFKPQLVILDIMMPGMSGIEVCREIRGHFPKETIQVLMLSAKDSQSDRRQALEIGAAGEGDHESTAADDYVTKPFHIASLARKIEYIFEKRKSEDAIAAS